MNGTSLGEHLQRALDAAPERRIIRRPNPVALKARAVILSGELRDFLGRRAALGADIRGMHYSLSKPDTPYERVLQLRASIDECMRDAQALDSRITEMLTAIYVEDKQ